MIFNDSLVFIHIPKTGGISCASYLLHGLKRPVYDCHRQFYDEKPIRGVVHLKDVHRHCTLEEALQHIHDFDGRSLADFRRVVAVIRHPCTLEYSWYRHLQKEEVRSRRRNPELLALAEGSFERFVAEAGYARPDLTQDAYVRVAGEIPEPVHLVRFEELGTAFPVAVADAMEKDIPFPHRNRTEYPVPIEEVLTDEVKERIYAKHRFMFDSGLYSL